MEMWLCIFLFAVLLGIVLPLLYSSGLAVTKCVRAILFIFLPGKVADRVTMDACTGWIRHVGRFRESRIYTFTLNAQLSRGDVEVSLLDQGKQPLLQLNRHVFMQSIELNEKNRYYLQWKFIDATGKCALRWDAAAPAQKRGGGLL